MRRLEDLPAAPHAALSANLSLKAAYAEGTVLLVFYDKAGSDF